MLMIQISDIHCGPMFSRKVFNCAVEEINDMKPDLVLITGDLTENGSMTEFRMAQEELGMIKAKKNCLFERNP